MIDQLEIAVAHHELPRLRAVSMVFGKSYSRGVLSTNCVKQRLTGEPCIRFRQSCTGAFDNGRKQIHVGYQLADNTFPRNVWSADDQRDGRGAFIQIAFPE